MSAGNGSTQYLLWRKDSQGNASLVNRFHSRQQAERVCARFQTRRQRERFWVSALGPDSKPPHKPCS
ncbi:hypothetical protein [Alloalcanivorax mobilis]|uniref:hypothetical protein n=1 Tax=Alloalcanivorax mobilis TaxID=2019569 RepID=UPI000B5B12D4|nr:hypothetical protein [Alloalcanivorax mobilis]ASK33518.1 hypothetical protein CEK62_03500 [Alcanivorax sp. N3-2A]|tara:strand:+ start:19140 stop:19340 length:201 start_codon:yes stop_codon:yes gene_type:complete